MDTLDILSRGAKPRSARPQALRIPSASRSSKPHVFGNKVDRSNRTSKLSTAQGNVQPDKLPGYQSIASKSDAEEPSRWTNEECRQYLRSHKLKIVQLWRGSSGTEDAPNPSPRKKRKSRAKAEDNEPQKKERRSEIIPVPLVSFEQLRTDYRLPETLLRNLDGQGYMLSTEVQMGSLPLLLHDRCFPQYLHHTSNYGGVGKDEATQSNNAALNLIAIAPTGSGKTLAFLIPLIRQLILDFQAVDRSTVPHGPQAIILVPTKELAAQIVNEAQKLMSDTSLSVDSTVRAAKSFPTSEAVSTANILVSTPGSLARMLENEDSPLPQLSTVGTLVLDEADVLLDPFFRDQTLRVWSACACPELHVSLWSATIGSNIESIAKEQIESRWLSLAPAQRSKAARPILVRLVVGLKDSSIPNIEHKLVYAASEQGKLLGLRQLLRGSSVSSSAGFTLRPPVLVFTQTIPRAIALRSELLYDIPAEAGGPSRLAVFHSDLSDSVRDHIMTRFRRGEIFVLITTDLLARGVDFKGVNGVVSYDLPNSSAAYVHRAGRTGRAGRDGGASVTLYSKEDLAYVKHVANVIAASERQRSGGTQGEEAQRWLLDLLPKVSKKERQQLKKQGVESRRTPTLKRQRGDHVNKKTRISTKTAYDRRVENRKRGALEASKKRKVLASDAMEEGRDGSGGESDEFAAFED